MEEIRHKQCIRCHSVLPRSEFHKDKRRRDGLYVVCKRCHRSYQRNWEKDNVEYVRKRRNKYLRVYVRERMARDPRYRLDKEVGQVFTSILRNKKGGGKWLKLLGYSVDDLLKHIEAQFADWMTWENHGEWHLDHRLPKNYFKYQTADDEEFKKCWALENLQPLSAEENLKKGSRVIYPIN